MQGQNTRDWERKPSASKAMPSAQSCALSPLGTCMTTACKPRETKALQEKTAAPFGHLTQSNHSIAEQALGERDKLGDLQGLRHGTSKCPASTRHWLTAGILFRSIGKATEILVLFLVTCTFFPKSFLQAFKMQLFADIFLGKPLNTWSPMFICKILPLLQLPQIFHPPAKFLFRLYSSIWWTEMYWINRNKPQECPHPGTACVAWDSPCSPLCQCADLP